MKKLFRVLVLTIVTAGIFSTAAYPTYSALNTKSNASPIPTCDPWQNQNCH